MKKFALLAVYVDDEGMVFVESTDTDFLKQVVKELKSIFFISFDLSWDVPYKVRLGQEVKISSRWAVYEYCCERGWEPFGEFKGSLDSLLFRKQMVEEEGE